MSISNPSVAAQLDKAVAFFSGAEMPAQVWSRKYRLRDKADNFLEDSPIQTFCRMADSVNSPANSSLRQNLVNRRFVPAGRQLFALGNPYFKAAVKNCLTGDSMVLTDEGWLRLDKIASMSTASHDARARIDGESKSATAWSNGVKKIIRVTTKEGYTIKSTADHRFRMEDGEWCTAGSLANGDLLDLGYDARPYGEASEDDFAFGYAAGLFLGDGTYAGQDFKVANIRLFGQKSHVPINLIASMFGGQPLLYEDHTAYNSSEFARVLKSRLGMEHGNKTITDQMMRQSSSFHAGFLRGFFDADACVTLAYRAKGTIESRNIRLGQSDLEDLQKVQTLLLGFGVKSKIYTNGEAGIRDFGDRGSYECRAAWVLNISRASFRRFVEQIGFSHPDKAAKAQEAVKYGKFQPEIWTVRVESVEEAGEEEVFDMSVDDIHAFNANGLIAHNCFVLLPKDDSLESISELRGEMARTYAMGGGVGIDLSRLRPLGAPVNNSAITSSGAASFADGFSHLTGEIGQNGRRGALMISLSVDHPDVQQFIRTKGDFSHAIGEQLRERLPRSLFKQLVEEVIDPRRKCANANMSVRITDRFMRAIEEGKPHVTRYVMDNGDILEKVFDARELWMEILTGAWEHGCPGVMFWDTMVKEDNRSYLDERWHIVTVNPCIRGKERILTRHGWRRIEDLDGQDVEVFDGLSFTKGKVWQTGRKKIVRLHTNTGRQIDVTADHRILTNEGWIEAAQCEGKKLPISQPAIRPTGDRRLLKTVTLMNGTQLNQASDELMEALGFLQGDGSLPVNDQRVGVHFTPNKDGEFVEEVVLPLLSAIAANKDEHNYKPSLTTGRDGGGACYRFSREKLASWLTANGFHRAPLPNRLLPEVVWSLTPTAQAAFLRGLFGANGNVINTTRHAVNLVSTCKPMLNEVQMLMQTMGIVSRVRTHSKPQAIEWDNGEYVSRESFRLEVTHQQDVFMFNRLIGFPQESQQQRLASIVSTARPQPRASAMGYREEQVVTQVEHLEIEDYVYDFQAPTTNTGLVSGLLVHNCGEQALSDGGSCNLGAINLARFTSDPYTERAKFDWDLFKQAIRDGVDFLDEVNDVELREGRAPLKKQAEVTEGLRQIGLGVMGYGDLLLQHQIRYASGEAMEFTERLFRCLRDTSYHQSIMRAKELGSFPAYSWEQISRSPFIQRLPAEILRLMEMHGLRNSNVLSIAPTGSIAMMGETTSGIEPEFAFQMTRSCNLGNGKRTKFTFLTPTAHRLAKALGKSVPQGEIEGRVDMSWLPEWAVAAHQIDPCRRTEVQGLIQQFIDVSISSTVNLPEDATLEDVADVYMTAYKSGCKGITIYREGSRGGVLETLSEEERIEYPIEPPLQIQSKRISFKGENGLQRILINVGDYRPGLPCEVSVIHGKSGTEVASYASALGIVISIALQNGVHPIKLARALEGINAGWASRLPLDGKGEKPTTVQSVPDAVAAVMRKFYDNGIYEKGLLGQPINGETNQTGWELTTDERQIARNCPKCQKQTYIPDAGCWKCINPACDVGGLCG